jgi:Putative Actinobacterial Holin-X, holin superfamily III
MPELRPELRDDRSLGEVFGQLTQDMTLLVRQEVQLARTELGEKISGATTKVISIAAGGLVAYVGALALVAALILALHDLAGIAPWVSALIVGGLLVIVGYVMLQRGRRELKQTDLTPRRTVETLKDDVQWAKEQTR